MSNNNTELRDGELRCTRVYSIFFNFCTHIFGPYIQYSTTPSIVQKIFQAPKKNQDISKMVLLIAGLKKSHRSSVAGLLPLHKYCIIAK